jgi:hypothetical protein
MRPTKKRFVRGDRIDAILIGTSVVLMICSSSVLPEDG